MKETIKRIIMERQEAEIPKIIERKYNFDKEFNEILAII